MLRNNRGQWALVEILVVVAIIGVLAYFLIPRYIGEGGGVNSGAPATPKQRAEGVECMNNLRQIHYAIGIQKQSSERIPTSLSDLASSGIPAEMLNCPVSQKPYSYDPTTGRAWCTTPGHEAY